MNLKHPVLAFALLSLIVAGAWARDISVAPGQGTLAAAVAGASNGDTLILEDGGFYGYVKVNKSLTIRPVNRATNAVVDGPVYIEGYGIRVTFQGLKFSGSVNLTQAAAIRLLENEWLAQDLNGYNYQSSQGDGSLAIVGNRFASGSSIKPIFTDGAYIAGNVLFGGMIYASAYVWIVGNEVHSGGQAIYAGPGAGSFILANRVTCSSQNSGSCIQTESDFSLIAGNLVQVNDTGSDWYWQTGIYASGSGEATIIDNVIRGLPANASRRDSAIYVETSGARVAGNIVVDWVSSSGAPIYVDSDTTGSPTTSATTIPVAAQPAMAT